MSAASSAGTAALAEHGSATADQLAAATGTSSRYAREWLEHQAVGGMLDVDDVAADAEDRRYSLPDAHAEVLLDRDSLAYVAPIARILAAAAKLMPDFLDAYRTGGGVPWTAFGAEGREAQAALTRPLFLHVFAQEWLPTLPEVHERLVRGGRVADVACGAGWSSIGIAKAYPDARVDGYDVDEASIELRAGQRRDRRRRRPGDVPRPRRRRRPAPAGDYDLVCVLEALHDMARPVEALTVMRSLAGDEGTVLVMDERAAEVFTRPRRRDRAAASTATASSAACRRDGGAAGAATGTVMRPDTLRATRARPGSPTPRCSTSSTRSSALPLGCDRSPRSEQASRRRAASPCRRRATGCRPSARRSRPGARRAAAGRPGGRRRRCPIPSRP